MLDDDALERERGKEGKGDIAALLERYIFVKKNSPLKKKVADQCFCF